MSDPKPWKDCQHQHSLGQRVQQHHRWTLAHDARRVAFVKALTREERRGLWWCDRAVAEAELLTCHILGSTGNHAGCGRSSMPP